MSLYTRDEREREDKVRTLPCPVCDAEPLELCYDAHPVFSHTGRYRAAAKAGLVPPLAGDR